MSPLSKYIAQGKWDAPAQLTVDPCYTLQALRAPRNRLFLKRRPDIFVMLLYYGARCPASCHLRNFCEMKPSLSVILAATRDELQCTLMMALRIWRMVLLPEMLAANPDRWQIIGHRLNRSGGRDEELLRAHPEFLQTTMRMLEDGILAALVRWVWLKKRLFTYVWNGVLLHRDARVMAVVAGLKLSEKERLIFGIIAH